MSASAVAALPVSVAVASPSIAPADAKHVSLLPDPIFAAIERHRAARIETQNCFAYTEGMGDGPARPIREAAMQPLDEAERAMCATVPTTAAGAVALLTYIRETESGGFYILEGSDNLDALLSSMECTFRNMAGLPVESVMPTQPVASQRDPIFAAIERHKTASLRQMEASRIYAETHTAPSLPGYDRDLDRRNRAAQLRATRTEEKAAVALATVRPQTLAGAVALLQYIDAFNGGAISLPDDCDDGSWRSSAHLWPQRLGEEDEDLFPFDLLSNVAAGLVQIVSGTEARS